MVAIFQLPPIHVLIKFFKINIINNKYDIVILDNEGIHSNIGIMKWSLDDQTWGFDSFQE